MQSNTDVAPWCYIWRYQAPNRTNFLQLTEVCTFHSSNESCICILSSGCCSSRFALAYSLGNQGQGYEPCLQKKKIFRLWWVSKWQNCNRWYLLDTETAGCSSVFLSLFCISALSWHHRSILSSCSTARKVYDALLPCSPPPQVALLSMDFCIQTLDFGSPVLGFNYLGTPSKTNYVTFLEIFPKWFVV